MALTIQRIHTEAALRALDPEWRALEAAHPFQAPEWSCAWWRHMADASLRIRDEPIRIIGIQTLGIGLWYPLCIPTG